MGRDHAKKPSDDTPTPEPAAPVSQATGGAWALVANDMEFGDVEVGESRTLDVVVWNTGPHSLRLATAGVSAPFVVARQPDWIYPSIAGPSAGLAQPLRVAFAPRTWGHFIDGMTLASADHPTAGPQVRLAGYGVRPGATRTDHQRELTEGLGAVARGEAADAALAEERKRGTPRHAGWDDAAERAFLDAASHLTIFFDHQENAIDKVSEHAGNYDRRRDADGSMARLGTVVASVLFGGLAGAVAEHVASALKDAGAGAGTAGLVKEIVKDVLKRSRGGGGGPAPTAALQDTRPDFFHSLQTDLANRRLAASLDLNQEKDRLTAVMRTNPAEGVAVMQGIAEALATAAMPAAQRTESLAAREWMIAIARGHLGTIAAGPKGAAAAVPVSEATGLGFAGLPEHGQPDGRLDGVLDLGFVVNPGRPREPARITLARMHGVNRVLVQTLAASPLVHERLVIRLSGVPTADSGLAELPITIARNEVGEMVVSDPHGILARRADPTPGVVATPELSRAGARALLVELLGTSLASQGVAIAHDDGRSE